MNKQKTNDMTVGNPVRLIIQFMIPMFLGNIFQQFYNIVDSIVAGQFIGVDALAAIGSTGSLMFFVTGWLNGLSSGFAIIVAQMFGAKKYDDMRHFVAMSIYLMFGFAAAMTIGFLVFNVPILRLMNSPADLMGDVAGYMGIIYAGLLVTAAYNTLAAFLRALGDSKSPLYFLIISAGINVVLDIVLIRFAGMGVEGCAYATVIAQGVSAICCLVYIKKKYPILHLEKKNFELRKGSMSKLLILGIPMGLQFSITAIGSIMLQSANNALGSACIAAFASAVRIKSFFICPFESLGIAMATYTGQNYGAGKPERIWLGIKASGLMMIVYAAFSFLILMLASRELTLIFVDPSETEIINDAVQFLHISCSFFPILGVLCILRYTIQGAGFTNLAMLSGVSEMIARTLVSIYAVPAFGFMAVCFGDATAWMAADLFLIPAFIYVYKKIKRVKR